MGEPHQDDLIPRDVLALLALVGLLAGRGEASAVAPVRYATLAYEYADAMIAARSA